MNLPIQPQAQPNQQPAIQQPVAQPAAQPQQNSSFAAPIQNPGQQQPTIQPGAQNNLAQPQQQAPVAKTYMTREEYIGKFGDDAGFLEPSAWEQKKRAREQQYDPGNAAITRMQKQMDQMANMITGFVQQTTTKDMSVQYADLYKQQQAAFAANNIPEANRLEQEKLKLAAQIGSAGYTQPQQPQHQQQNDPDQLAANAYLNSTEWARDPVLMQQATAIYKHLDATRPDLNEVQKVVEIDRRVKSMGSYTQPAVMPSQGVIPNPPQQQFGNGVKDFANLPQAAKDGFNQLKGFRSDINPEIYAKNWYARNGQ